MPASTAQFEVRPVPIHTGACSEYSLQPGDFVEYRPIGGAQDNVVHSKGEIKQVIETEGGGVRYAIKNEHTGKVTKYQVWIILVYPRPRPHRT